tara:strand:+ start:953 stop:1963 length:1011 start_codon:yes stop_codon:yes gene_type:complete
MKIFDKIGLAYCLIISFISCDQPDIIDVPEHPKKLVAFVVGVSKNHELPYGKFRKGWTSDIGLSLGVLDIYCRSQDKNISPVMSLSNQSDQIVAQSEDMYIEGCSYRYYMDSLLIPEGGVTYHLDVSDTDFGELKSSYTHPDMVSFEIHSIEHAGKGVYDEDGDGAFIEEGNFYDLIIEIDDPHETNYYELDLEYTINSPGYSGSYRIDFDFVGQHQSYSKHLFGSNEGRNLYDVAFNGGRHELLIKIFVSDFSFQNMKEFGASESMVFSVILRNYSPELYRYYDETYLQSLSEQDPNGAPMPVQTNIEGGFGVFGGYAENLQSIEVDLVDLAEGE